MKTANLELLTKHISALKDAEFGEWIIDRQSDGSAEHPIQMPFVRYSESVVSFQNDFYLFHKENPQLDLGNYKEILENNGLSWNREVMKAADESKLDEQCLLALIMGAIRAERFSNGALRSFLQDGSIVKWLTRLAEIENGL